MTQTNDSPPADNFDEPSNFSGDTTALAALNRSEIDVQISTAKRFPRSIALAKRKMIEMATIDEETAKGCGYALKRKDKDGNIAWIEGPSIRMAEIAVSCWGNLRYGARVIAEDDRFITAQGVCHDLETNVQSSMEVRRGITTRNGRKYGNDMIAVTANAASAIAARNAVFKVVPRIIIDAAYNAAMKTASGDEKTFDARRRVALQSFVNLSVTLEQVMKVLGKENGGLEDIDTTDLRRLHGLLTAINTGETTVDQIFAEPTPATNTNGAAAMTEKIKANTPAQAAQPSVSADSPSASPAAGGSISDEEAALGAAAEKPETVKAPPMQRLPKPVEQEQPEVPDDAPPQIPQTGAELEAAVAGMCGITADEAKKCLRTALIKPWDQFRTKDQWWARFLAGKVESLVPMRTTQPA